jgi:hypothetical protein
MSELFQFFMALLSGIFLGALTIMTLVNYGILTKLPEKNMWRFTTKREKRENG